MAAHPAPPKQRVTEINVYFSKHKCTKVCFFSLMADEAHRKPGPVDNNSEFSWNTFESIWKRHLHGDLNPWPFHFATVFLIIKPSSCTNPSVMGDSITVPGPQISACMVSQYLLGLNIPSRQSAFIYFIMLLVWLRQLQHHYVTAAVVTSS